MDSFIDCCLIYVRFIACSASIILSHSLFSLLCYSCLWKNIYVCAYFDCKCCCRCLSRSQTYAIRYSFTSISFRSSVFVQYERNFYKANEQHSSVFNLALFICLSLYFLLSSLECTWFFFFFFSLKSVHTNNEQLKVREHGKWKRDSIKQNRRVDKTEDLKKPGLWNVRWNMCECEWKCAHCASHGIQTHTFVVFHFCCCCCRFHLKCMVLLLMSISYTLSLSLSMNKKVNFSWKGIWHFCAVELVKIVSSHTHTKCNIIVIFFNISFNLVFFEAKQCEMGY